MMLKNASIASDDSVHKDQSSRSSRRAEHLSRLCPLGRLRGGGAVRLVSSLQPRDSPAVLLCRAWRRGCKSVRIMLVWPLPGRDVGRHRSRRQDNSPAEARFLDIARPGCARVSSRRNIALPVACGHHPISRAIVRPLKDAVRLPTPQPRI